MIDVAREVSFDGMDLMALAETHHLSRGNWVSGGK